MMAMPSPKESFRKPAGLKRNEKKELTSPWKLFNSGATCLRKSWKIKKQTRRSRNGSLKKDG